MPETAALHDVLFPIQADHAATTVSAQVQGDYKEGDAFLKQLKRAITCWVQTTEAGRKAWEESSEDFNVGDLSLWQEAPSLVEILQQYGLHNLKVTVTPAQAAPEWTFDTVLVNWEDLEEEYGEESRDSD